MRAVLAAVSLLMVCLPAVPSDEEHLHEDLLMDLRWYVHWMRGPTQEVPTRCAGEIADVEVLAYCQPGPVIVNLTKDNLPFKPVYIGATPETYENAIGLLRQRHPASAAQHPFDYSFSLNEVALYRASSESSEAWARDVKPYMDKSVQHVVDAHLAKPRLFFPLAARSDPSTTSTLSLETRCSPCLNSR